VLEFEQFPCEWLIGQLLSTVKCKPCNKEYFIIDPFMDLTFSVPQNVECTIFDCFNHFSEEEELEDLYYCSNCGQKTNSTKKIEIWKFPKILIIKLKKSAQLGNKQKNSVDFQVSDLELSRFQKCNNSSSLKFDLFATSNHLGKSSNEGHYISYCKHENGNWYKFDDQNVTQRSIDKPSSVVLFFKLQNSF